MNTVTLLILTVVTVLLSACSNDEIEVPHKTTYRLPKVKTVKVVIEPDGSMKKPSVDITRKLVKALRTSEGYYYDEATPIPTIEKKVWWL